MTDLYHVFHLIDNHETLSQSGLNSFLGIISCTRLGEDPKKDYGIYLKEIKSREVYELIDGNNTLAQLQLIKVGGASNMPAAMERGEIQIGLGGVPPVASFIDKGNSFKILCPLQTEGDLLVVKPDFPADNWESFVEAVKNSEQPVKIGYKAPVAAAKLIFMRALKEEGITYNVQDAKESKEEKPKIELVNLQGDKNMMPSLASGAVDGFVMNQPEVSLTVHKKVGKVICDLADLPPKGKWKRHPCCCVSATADVIAKHKTAVRGLLKLIILSTEIVNKDKDLAIKDTVAWTKMDEEVERDSIASLFYLAIPDEGWKKGMITWAEIMNEIGQFKKQLKGKEPTQVVQEICDLTIIEEAHKELKTKGVIK